MWPSWRRLCSATPGDIAPETMETLLAAFRTATEDSG